MHQPARDFQHAGDHHLPRAMRVDAADERQRARVQDRIVQVSGVVAPEGLFRSPWRGRRAANGGINPPANDRNKRAHEV